VITVRDHLDQLGDALTVVVTFAGDPARLVAYREHLDIDFPVLTDTDRSLYRLLGAGRGSWWRVWSPGTLALYARLLRRGRRLRRPTEDTRQLGGDAVIDRHGRVARVWLPERPDARPPIDELIDAVRSVDRR
jgi:peroxiredoxin